MLASTPVGLDLRPTKKGPPSTQYVHASVGANQTAQEGSNLFGQDNVNYPILETYAEGAVIEVKVVVSTYHWVSFAAFLKKTLQGRLILSSLPPESVSTKTERLRGDRSRLVLICEYLLRISPCGLLGILLRRYACAGHTNSGVNT